MSDFSLRYGTAAIPNNQPHKIQHMPVHSNKHCTQTTLTTTQQLHTVQPLYQPLYLPISQTHDPQNQILKTYNLQRTHVLLQNTTINQLSITHYQDFYIQHSTTASSNTQQKHYAYTIKTSTSNTQPQHHPTRHTQQKHYA